MCSRIDNEDFTGDKQEGDSLVYYCESALSKSISYSL